MIDPREHIGEQYGIYVIVDVLDERDKWGHPVYKGECKECGFIKFGGLSEFKQKNVQTCKHINLLTEEQFEIWYKQNKIQCLKCGKDIPFSRPNDSPAYYKQRKFCNNSCAASYNNLGVSRNPDGNNGQINEIKRIYDKNTVHHCKNCGKEISYKREYCSNKCQQEFAYKQYINRWKQGLEDGINGKYSISAHIKKYLREKFNNKCSKCGWSKTNTYTNKVPLEVHHKDGNYLNNKEDNLELLCPNCHALTETYKGGNKGNGRKERNIYNN